MRLIAGSGVLAVYVAVLYPAGLLDESPTVLGLRTFALVNQDSFDAVVPLQSLTTRVERALSAVASGPTLPVPDDAPASDRRAVGTAAEVTLTLPAEVHTVTWAAISPPRGGWTALPATTVDLLDRVARSGIAEVAAAVPTGTGEQIVHRVRSDVWGKPIRGLDHVPAGAAFAALSLGFLGEDGDESIAIRETGPWTRLTTKRGHVLVKRRAWSLSG